MAASLPIIATLATTAITQSQANKQNKYRKSENQRKQKLQNIQFNEKKSNIEQQRKQRSAALRAQIGASGISLNSSSAKTLFNSINRKANDDINTLNQRNSIANQSLLDNNGNNDASSLLAFLNNLRRFR